MGLSHPPGWDNISPDVKIGGYSCLKSENFVSQKVVSPLISMNAHHSYCTIFDLVIVHQVFHILHLSA